MRIYHIALAAAVSLFTLAAPVHSQTLQQSHSIPIAGKVYMGYISPDGKFCTVRLEDKPQCIIYNLFEEEIVAELTYTESVSSVGYSPDSKFLFTILENGETDIYDLSKKKLFKRIRHPHIDGIQFSSNGLFVALKSNKMSASVYQLNDDFRHIHTIRHRESIKNIAFSPNNALLITASADNRLGIFDLYTEEQHFISADENFNIPLSFSHNGKYLLAVLGDFFDDRVDIVIDVHSMQIVKRFPPRIYNIDTLAGSAPRFTANGKYIFNSNGFYRVGSWEKLHKGIEYKYIIDESKPILDVICSPSNKAYAVVQDSKLKYYPSLYSHEPSKTIAHEIFENTPDEIYLTCVEFSPNGKYMLACNSDQIILIDTLNPQILYSNFANATNICGYGFSSGRDGLFAVVLTDSAIQFYPLETKK